MRNKQIYLEFINDTLFHKFILEWMITLTRRQPSSVCNDIYFEFKDLYSDKEILEMIKEYEVHNNSNLKVDEEYIESNLNLYKNDFSCVVLSSLKILKNINSKRYFLEFEDRDKELLLTLNNGRANGNWDEDPIEFKKDNFPELNEKENVNKIKHKLYNYHNSVFPSSSFSISHPDIFSIIVFYVITLASYQSDYKKIQFINSCNDKK